MIARRWHTPKTRRGQRFPKRNGSGCAGFECSQLVRFSLCMVGLHGRLGRIPFRNWTRRISGCAQIYDKAFPMVTGKIGSLQGFVADESEETFDGFAVTLDSSVPKANHV